MGVSDKVLLFADEAGFSLHPKLGRIWSKKGKQPIVYTASQHQKRLNVFGWVNPVTGMHGMMKAEQGNTIGFLAFLKRIAYRFKDRCIEVWVDQAKWHKGDRIDQFLRIHTHMIIEYIPKYHPELNFQERLWKCMRYEETTNTYYDTFGRLDYAVFSRSRRWKPKKLKSLCHLI